MDKYLLQTICVTALVLFAQGRPTKMLNTISTEQTTSTGDDANISTPGDYIDTNTTSGELTDNDTSMASQTNTVTQTDGNDGKVVTVVRKVLSQLASIQTALNSLVSDDQSPWVTGSTSLEENSHASEDSVGTVPTMSDEDALIPPTATSNQHVKTDMDSSSETEGAHSSSARNAGPNPIIFLGSCSGHLDKVEYDDSKNYPDNIWKVPKSRELLVYPCGTGCISQNYSMYVLRRFTNGTGKYACEEQVTIPVACCHKTC